METSIDEVSIQIGSNSEGASSGLDNLKNSIDKLYSSLDMTLNKLNQFSSAISNLQSKASQANSLNLSKMNNANFNAGALNVDNSGLDKVQNITDKISISSLKARDSVKSIASAFTSVGNGAMAAGNKLSKVSGFFSKGVHKIKEGLGSIFKGSRKAFDGDHISRGFKKLLKYAFALFSIRGTYALLNSAANKWLSSNDQAAKQLSANIDYLKFAAGSALAPIIERLVSLVYALLRGIQKVAYALTGVNIFANATASSMSSAAGSAKEAAKALAPFDELNVIDFGNSSGGGGGGIGPSLDLSELDGATNSILEAIKNGDWYEVGKEIAEKFNEALEKIDWTKIQNTAKKIAENTALLLNGFIENTKWDLVGKTIGEGINTAITFAESFIDTFNWRGLGSSAATTLNSALQTTNWNKAAKTVSKGIEGMLDTAIGFVKDFEWKPLVDAVGDGIEGADWDGLSDKGFELLGAGAASLVNLGQVLYNAYYENIEKEVDFYVEKVKEAGGDIMQGVLNGIGEKLSDIGNWIKEHVFDPIVKGFKETFKIQSPSKVMKDEVGNYIGEGLLEGIAKPFSDLGKWIKEHVVDPVVNGFKSLFGIQSPSKVMKDEVGTYVGQGLLEGIAKPFIDISNWIKDNVFNPIINGFKSLFGIQSPSKVMKDEVGTYVGQGLLEGIANSLNNIGTWLKEHVFDPIVNGFKSLFGIHSPSTVFEGLGGNMMEGLYNGMSGLIGKITGIGETIKTGLQSILSNMNIHIKLPHFTWSSVPASGWIANILSALNLPTSLPKLNVSWYAQGGFPDEGELFVANEAGPEMIGNIGNRTAVANNDQITTAISKATYEAFSQAFKESSNGQKQPVNVYIGNKKVYSGYGEYLSSENNMYGTNTIKI